MKLLLGLFAFLTTFLVVSTFDCYECENCQIPFNSQTNTATCGSSVTQCMKVTAKLGTVYTYVYKQCGPCSNETFLFGVTYLRVDCCTGNNCNGTSALTSSSILIVLLLLAFVTTFFNKKE